MLNTTVGEAFVLQQTPRAETGAPPSAVIEPPEVAVVCVMAVKAVVVRTGNVTGVVTNEISFPYAVPAALVAYART